MAARNTLHDIRVWARENGWPDINDSGPLPPGARRAYDSRDSTVDTQPGPLSSVDTEPDDAPKVETPPQMAEATPITKAKSFLDKARERAQLNKAIAPRRKDSKPRASVERFIGRGWEMLARLANPVNPPMGRVLAMQAPVAGMLLDDIVKDTIVDSVMQPLVRAEEKLELAFALVGPPLIVGALTVKPEAQAVLIPMLKESLHVWLEVAGDKLEAAKQKEAAFKAKYGDTIDEMINAIFAPPDTSDDKPAS